MKITVYSQGQDSFPLDAEYQEPAVREAIEDGCNDVPSVIIDWTDTERSNISHDHYAVVAEDNGTEKWRGWLTGVKDRPAPEASLRSQLEALLAEYDREAKAHGKYAESGESLEAARSAGKSAVYDRCATDLRELLGGGPQPGPKPVVIVFDPRECGMPWLDELASAVREQSGGRVLVTEVDAQMSDCMIAVAAREVGYDEAVKIWHGEDGAL